MMRIAPAVAVCAASLAGAAPAAAQEAAPGASAERVSLRYNQIRRYEPDGEEGIWFKGRRGGWYYAELVGGCPEINHGHALGVGAAGNDTIDAAGALHVGKWRCRLGGLIRSDPPPPKAERKAGRAARRG